MIRGRFPSGCVSRARSAICERVGSGSALKVVDCGQAGPGHLFGALTLVFPIRFLGPGPTGGLRSVSAPNLPLRSARAGPSWRLPAPAARKRGRRVSRRSRLARTCSMARLRKTRSGARSRGRGACRCGQSGRRDRRLQPSLPCQRRQGCIRCRQPSEQDPVEEERHARALAGREGAAELLHRFVVVEVPPVSVPRDANRAFARRPQACRRPWRASGKASRRSGRENKKSVISRPGPTAAILRRPRFRPSGVQHRAGCLFARVR